MQVELKRIQQEVGITFIYVTHDQEEAMTMSDRIAVMNRGRYEQLGRSREPVRATRDALRRRVPRASATCCREVSRASMTPTRPCVLLDDTRVRAPAAAVDGRGKVEPRRPAGEDPPAACRTSRLRAGTTSSLAWSATRRTSASAPSTQIETRGGARLTVYEQNVERATRAELWSPGEQVLMTWSPDHSFVVREDRGAPMSRRPSTTPARPVPPARPTHRPSVNDPTCRKEIHDRPGARPYGDHLTTPLRPGRRP